MRRTSDEVAAAARRRLALLQEELSRSGLSPYADTEPPAEEPAPAAAPSDRPSERPYDEPYDEPEPWLPRPPAERRGPTALELREAGRHARRSRDVGEQVSGWLADRLPAALQGRVRLGRGHLLVVGLLAVVAVLTAMLLAAHSRGTGPVARVSTATATDSGSGRASVGSSPLVPGTAVSGGVAGAAASPSAGASAGAAPAAAGGPSPTGSVVVDVAGKVRHPGVVRLDAGSRVVDAIERAGGVVGHPRLLGLNRARVLVDGEQILVGIKAAPGVAASAAAAPGAPTGGGDMVNLNLADEQQLEELPGVGPVTAQKILEWRTQHGSFTSVDELMEVDGIGEKTLAEIAPHATL